MATNRKLGRTTDIRLAMLKTQVTDLLWHGKIETTVTRAKETKAIADSLIALAVKEAGNFEEVEVKVSKAKLDEKGNKVTELVKSKNGREYLKVVREETTEKRKKDFSKAVQLFKKACDGGHMLGCHNLGVMYQKGNGVKKNEQKAAELYKKAH